MLSEVAAIYVVSWLLFLPVRARLPPPTSRPCFLRRATVLQPRFLTGQACFSSTDSQSYPAAQSTLFLDSTLWCSATKEDFENLIKMFRNNSKVLEFILEKYDEFVQRRWQTPNGLYFENNTQTLNSLRPMNLISGSEPELPEVIY